MWRIPLLLLLLLLLHKLQCATAINNNNEHINEIQRLGTITDDYHSPLPISYVNPKDLPQSFDWGDVGGRSFLTHSLNQHLPNWCGSCWGHGSLSALADRIKIARDGKSTDINLSVQYVLNCGSDIAGSCHGGSASGLYEFVKGLDSCHTIRACHMLLALRILRMAYANIWIFRAPPSTPVERVHIWDVKRLMCFPLQRSKSMVKLRTMPMPSRLKSLFEDQ